MFCLGGEESPDMAMALTLDAVSSLGNKNLLARELRKAAGLPGKYTLVGLFTAPAPKSLPVR